jgi:hypothetical protein
MAEPNKSAGSRPAGSDQKEFNIDFAAMLPDWDGFPVWWLAKRWQTSERHWLNLIDDGEIAVCVDLRRSGSSRSMTRCTRASLLNFLTRRKDIAAVLAANPKPKYSEASRRKPKR